LRVTCKGAQTLPLDRIEEFQGNLKKLSKKNLEKLKKRIIEDGFNVPFFVWDHEGMYKALDGHQRIKALCSLREEGWDIPLLPVAFIEASDEQDARKKLLAISSQYGEFDSAELSEWLDEIGGEVAETLRLVDTDIPIEVASEEKEVKDAEPQVDKAEELNQKWQVKQGDVWQLGDHRLMCGDSTKKNDVEKLMNGIKAILLHADPPYGMGKEKDGIANDNLYREKLDEFQMQWWKTYRQYLENNASAYIWGNTEDLWRLWYLGGLRDSERLTFRNEIVWDKENGQGIGSGDFRMFPTTTERCLFFMLGEQGFNNNADNYWDGWEPIRKYLDEERKYCGWSNKDVAKFFGFHPRMADHWFSVSQWSMPREDQYNRLKKESNGKAFKREYDDLKREFYATRAYFDNTHENMTDVWNYSRVVGEDRHSHATPKPVDMICRALKSSAPEKGICIEPFIGSGTTLIACEKTSRICYGMEIDPNYCAVVLEWWSTITNRTPEKEE
jgi:DNA modification methylase